MAKCITISHSAEGIRMEVSSGSWLMWSNQVQLAEAFAHKHAECEELRERERRDVEAFRVISRLANSDEAAATLEDLRTRLSSIREALQELGAN